ncbi:hypothetical protein LWI28_005360 [Acer negundo]|uniref:Uncharacterized protein n=1 Tax=Acer negundo TaxID=4023 RepID=A0AAD5JDC9_ACENE|nr:hypothetical protein LWI28_005360 [Acer negundo]
MSTTKANNTTYHFNMEKFDNKLAAQCFLPPPPPPPSLGPPLGAAPLGTLPLLVFCDLAVTSAFFAFFSSLVLLIRSLISRRAASLAASRTSGFSALLFWITSRVAPIMDLDPCKL